jgi:hypothetical protein
VKAKTKVVAPIQPLVMGVVWVGPCLEPLPTRFGQPHNRLLLLLLPLKAPLVVPLLIPPVVVVVVAVDVTAEPTMLCGRIVMIMPTTTTAKYSKYSIITNSITQNC